MTYELINTISNILTSIGTVGATVTALYLSFRENKPRLTVFATIGLILPGKNQHVWMYCVNESKLPIVCTGFSFTYNKFSKKAWCIMPTLEEELSKSSKIEFPCMLQYSMRVDKHYTDEFLKDKVFKDHLSQNKWLARKQLKYLWCIIASSNIREFKGKLSKSLIEKILSYHFPK